MKHLILWTCAADGTSYNGAFTYPESGYVGEDGIEPNTAYKIERGRWVRPA